MEPVHLHMGVTRADFQSAGKWWFRIDLLNKDVRLVSRACDPSLISFESNPSTSSFDSVDNFEI